MPTGTYRGSPLKGVPAEHLLWMATLDRTKQDWPELVEYVESHMDELHMEASGNWRGTPMQ